MDTDIGGDIDDLCALAMVLNFPETELAAVTTVSEIGGKRAGYARFVLDLAGRLDVPVAPGADVSARYYRHWQPRVHRDEHSYWPRSVRPIAGSEGEALTLIERSIKEGIAIAAIGPYTNLALLERRSPGILADAKLFLMGGFVFPPRQGFPQWTREMDYNVQVDPESAIVVFEQSDPVLVPLAVTVETALRRFWLPKLNGAGSIGKLVARQAEAFEVEEPIESRLVGTCDALPNDIINFLHDPLACAIALDWDEGVVIRQLPLRSEMQDGYVRQTHDGAGKPTRVVTQVDGPSFSEYWLKTVCTNGIGEDCC